MTTSSLSSTASTASPANQTYKNTGYIDHQLLLNLIHSNLPPSNTLTSSVNQTTLFNITTFADLSLPNICLPNANSTMGSSHLGRPRLELLILLLHLRSSSSTLPNLYGSRARLSLTWPERRLFFNVLTGKGHVPYIYVTKSSVMPSCSILMKSSTITS